MKIEKVHGKGRGLVPAVTGTLGGLLFLIGTVLHPARDGAGIAQVGDWYGVTHSIQALGLALQVACLIALRGRWGTMGVMGLSSWVAVSGTLAWFGLIVFDGNVNPTMARYDPDLVHSGEDLDPGSAAILIPALLLFPAGYIALGTALARWGDRWAGILLAIGAVTYWVGGLLIFAAGPEAAAIQVLEVLGAVPFCVGFVLLALRDAPRRHSAQLEPDRIATG